MKTLVYYLSKFINTIATQWLYILITISIPAVLFMVGQGVEIMNTIVEVDHPVNMFLILLAFYLLYYALWVLNPYSIKVLNMIHRLNGEAMLNYQQQIDLYNKTFRESTNSNSYISIRNFANLPLIIFSMLVLNWIVLIKSPPFFVYFSLFIVFNMILNYTQNFYFRLYNLLNRLKLFYNNPVWSGYIIALIGLFIISLLWIGNSSCQKVAAVLLFLFVIYNNSFYYFIEHRKNSSPKAVFEGNKLRYKICITILFTLLGVFYTTSKNFTLNYISPIAIATVCITLYLLIFDGLISTPSIFAENLYYDTYRKSLLNLLALFMVVLFIYSFYKNPFSNHHLHKGLQTNIENTRQDLNTAFDQYLHKNELNEKDTIYLVCGQGGGSRASAWTFLNLNKLYDKPIFAVSTVSGSSSGANNFIHKKYTDLIQKKKNEDPTICKKLYEHNYLSQALWGFLLKDGVFNTVLRQRDRNYYHQQEEKKVFREAYSNKNFDLDNLIKNIQHEDYLSKYLTEHGHKLPYLFTNSTATQNGKRVICSPLEFDSLVFTAAIDLYGEFKKIYPGYNFEAYTAVDVSQSFPFISASCYLKEVANFIDGALYENTGANTLFEIYYSLKKHHPSQIFKIIAITSSDEEVKNTNQNKSEIGNTLSSAASFSSHSYYWLKKLEYMTKEYHDVFEEKALHKVSHSSKDIALAIYLSKSTMNLVYQSANH